MEHRANQLQGQSSNANVPTAFVNHGGGLRVLLVGLLLWNQTRQHWVQNRKIVNKKQVIQKPKSNSKSNTTYNRLLGSKKRFSQPIPLGQVVGFLVEIWEQEELYD